VREFRLHGFGRGAVSNDRPHRASSVQSTRLRPTVDRNVRRHGGGECGVAGCDHNHHDGAGGQFYQSDSLRTSMMRDVANTVISK
jgi:hypothetical protein